MRDNIDGTAFGGTSAEAQTSIPYLPSDFALKFADAGSVSGGNVLALSQSFAVGSTAVMCSSVGAGLIWSRRSARSASTTRCR